MPRNRTTLAVLLLVLLRLAQPATPESATPVTVLTVQNCTQTVTLSPPLYQVQVFRVVQAPRMRCVLTFALASPAPWRPLPPSGAPAPVYGAPAPGYGVPDGAPAPVYGAPAPVYGVPSPVYGTPAPANSQPAYNTPAPNYGNPPPSYTLPAPVYGVPVSGYGTPAPVYGVPSSGYGTPAPVYGTPAPIYVNPNYSTYGNPTYGTATYSKPASFIYGASGYEYNKPSYGFSDFSKLANSTLAYGKPAYDATALGTIDGYGKPVSINGKLIDNTGIYNKLAYGTSYGNSTWPSRVANYGKPDPDPRIYGKPAHETLFYSYPAYGTAGFSKSIYSRARSYNRSKQPENSEKVTTPKAEAAAGERAMADSRSSRLLGAIGEWPSLQQPQDLHTLEDVQDQFVRLVSPPRFAAWPTASGGAGGQWPAAGQGGAWATPAAAAAASQWPGPGGQGGSGAWALGTHPFASWPGLLGTPPQTALEPTGQPAALPVEAPQERPTNGASNPSAAGQGAWPDGGAIAPGQGSLWPGAGEPPAKARPWQVEGWARPEQGYAPGPTPSWWTPPARPARLLLTLSDVDVSPGVFDCEFGAARVYSVQGGLPTLLTTACGMDNSSATLLPESAVAVLTYASAAVASGRGFTLTVQASPSEQPTPSPAPPRAWSSRGPRLRRAGP